MKYYDNDLNKIITLQSWEVPPPVASARPQRDDETQEFDYEEECEELPESLWSRTVRKFFEGEA